MQRLGRKLDGARERALASALLDGTYSPPPPRPAVSVILTRAGTVGLEVFMLRRAGTMAFMPRRMVFPGGSVDEQDRRTPLSSDFGLADLAGHLGVPADDAGAKLTTAVRETFEETQVLLARPRVSRSPSPWAAGDLERQRRLVLDRTLTINELLDHYHLKVEVADLKPWARWITPAIAPVRFDVTFFLAVLPRGQSAADVSSEAQEATWWQPSALLAQAHGGKAELATTQRELLAELAEIPDLAAALDSPRRLTPICLQPSPVGDDYYLVYPQDYANP